MDKKELKRELTGLLKSLGIDPEKLVREANLPDGIKIMSFDQDGKRIEDPVRPEESAQETEENVLQKLFEEKKNSPGMKFLSNASYELVNDIMEQIKNFFVKAQESGVCGDLPDQFIFASIDFALDRAKEHSHAIMDKMHEAIERGNCPCGKPLGHGDH